MVRWRVFVSHTSELADFPAGGSYLTAVKEAISACGHVIVEMAGFAAADLPAAELCRELVRSCDIYVGVLGTRYGSPVRDLPRVSYTELEYDTATRAALPRLVFLLDPHAPAAVIPPPGQADLEYEARQEEFRRRTQAEVVTRSFADPGSLGQLVERSLRDLAAREPRTAAGRAAGRLLAEVTDPFALEVHRPVEPDDWRPGLATLPPYVAREHDHELATLVRAAAEGRSGIAVLVGGSSTGKTRACWQALDMLRDQPAAWRVWHPIDPSRPDAALRELPSIGPRTVVWLNEAQFYLDTPGGSGERVAAGLRERLRDPDRAPVLVLATVWPQFWDTLTARPPAGQDDPHAQARELLAGRDISVPAAFSATQLRGLAAAEDPRLAQAAAAAPDGQVIQFLAGAPDLLARYRNAPPAAAALIDAAIDGRRLGLGPALPLAFLAAAAPAYLTDAAWDSLGDDWLAQALAFTAAPCKGTPGPLSRIRPRPGKRADPACRLADYLDQQGRRERRARIPPAGFWAAAASFARPGDLDALARRAEARGLLLDAARLRKRAAAQGDVEAALELFSLLRRLDPADPDPPRWVAAHVGLDDPFAVGWLLGELRQAGAGGSVSALLARAPAAHVGLEKPEAVGWLLRALRNAGADGQVMVLADRVAARVPLDDPNAVARLMGELREAGADAPVRMLADRVAAHVCLDDLYSVATLVGELREAGADGQVMVLADRVAARVSLDSPGPVAGLLGALREAGAARQATALADRAAQAGLDNPHTVTGLLDALRQAGATGQFTVLADRVAAQAGLDNPRSVDWLLAALRRVGADEQVSTLLDRDPAAQVSIDDPASATGLLDALRQAGATGQFTVLADRAAVHSCLDNPGAVAALMEALWRAGADGQVRVLLARDPAHRVHLGDPYSVARLLGALRGVSADGQVRVLLARDPAGHVGLDNPYFVAGLYDALRQAGADGQATALADRAAARVVLDNPDGVAALVGGLRQAGADQQATALADRAAAYFSLFDPNAVTKLVGALREVGAGGQATALADRAAAHVSLENPTMVSWWLRALRGVGADGQVRVLLARDPAGHVGLDDPDSISLLLGALREVGADGQVAALLSRDPAARVGLKSPDSVASLLDGLREAGADAQATALADRLPAEGMFELFRGLPGQPTRYQFGREPDGSPAPRWGWRDLD